MRSLAPLLLVSSLTPLASGQMSLTPSSLLDQGIPSQLSPVTRTVAGDFDGDFHNDVFAQAGGTLLMYYSPPHYSYWASTDVGALDLAGGRGLGTNGVDAVIISRANGPALVQYDPSASPDPFLVTDLGLSASWDGAQRVLVSEDDDDVLFGIDSTGLSLLVAEGVFGGTLSEKTPILLDALALDIVRADWSGDSDDEFVIFHEAGIDIYDRSGARLLDIDGAIDEAQVTAFRQDGYAKDRVAAVVGLVGLPDQALHIISDGLAEQSLPLGPSEVHALVAADFDNDGDDDLLMANRIQLNPADVVPFVFTNVSNGAAPSFGAGAFSLSPQTAWPIYMGVGESAGATQMAAPCVADFDRDGDLDMFYALDGARVSRFVRNGHHDHTQYEYSTTAAGDDGGTATFIWDENDILGTIESSSCFIELEVPQQTLAGVGHVLVVQRSAWLEQDGNLFISDPNQAELHTSAFAPEAQLVEYGFAEDGIRRGITVDMHSWAGGIRHFEISQAAWDGTDMSMVGPPIQVSIATNAFDSSNLGTLFGGLTELELLDGFQDESGQTFFTADTRDGGGIVPDVEPPRMGGGEDGAGGGSGGPPTPPPPPPPPGP